ncbi:putative zinc-containing alcohol dehydrogenase [Pseudomonas putida]|uniref:Putative zinc-containing alcohol dehydrogenase n=1 Tax=Pseudomonas putida TaxID=303 RepID=A0A379KPB4_PSEPU|nr:NADPH:quinone oxidoreductase family protein [Pseudomonas putida]SUD69759.1 putative zinc-containing alcohol dehydrogenase [Pseudomonas putida]
MRSYRVHEHGEPYTLQIDELPQLEPKAGEIVVDVKAAGINFPDVLVISGKYQLLPPLPFTPGKDFAGVVRAVGPGVVGYAPGDRIMSQIEWGAFAEQAITTPAQSFHMPDGLDFPEAAAMGLVYQTAYFALTERGQLKAGETVLIGGASGGIGLAAVQIAKGLGATVIAGVRNDVEAQVAKDSGADHIIDLSGNNLKDLIREQVYAVTDGYGADVVIDPLGDQFFAGAIRATAWCGRVVVIGFAAGEIPSVKVNYLLLKNIGVCGLQWSDYRDRTPEKVEAAQQALFQLWRKGAVKPRIMRLFDFDSACEALTLVKEGKVQGKAVVSMGRGV